MGRRRNHSIREAGEAIRSGAYVLPVDYGPRPSQATDEEWATWCDHIDDEAERGYIEMEWPKWCECDVCKSVRAMRSV